ncbi:MOSC domain-containing protein [Paenibacillus sp. DYY-L-2]|uniref:MOSC domain-containing protein n=1 Tax=Paenibacillus sp. DYY-L-2 TaxID=3447013 RepID=UPI003F50286A
MIRLLSVNTGQPAKLVHEGKAVISAIQKNPVYGELQLTRLNLEGDAQANRVRHGGPNKALCMHSAEHYRYFAKVLNREINYGDFGENLTVEGMTESEVCVGDVFSWGEAVIQVSQPRPPCHKLAKRFAAPGLPLWFQETGFTGFYLRVLREGRVGIGHPLEIMKRHPAGVTLETVNRVLYHDRMNMELISTILEVEELSSSCRITLEERRQGIDNDNERRWTGGA